jgi:putative phosphoribosyl transferase
MFADRTDAGRQLAAALKHYRAANPLVLALPRGGVVIGAEVVRALGGELDVMLVKKLRAPDNPELALGAICEDGRVFLNEEILQLSGASDAYIESERRARLREMAEQRNLYRKVKPRISPADRTAILVDDGLATGATMIAAAQAVALSKPRKLIVAVPVSPPDTARIIEQMNEVDELVCLATPVWFGGVGQFYGDFSQVSDEEVIAILKQFSPRHSPQQ